MLAHPETLTRSVQTSVERQIELTADSLWTDVAARLREALNDTTFQTWFGEVSGAEIDGDAFAVAVPNDFTREWIEGHFLDLMRAAVRDSGGGDLRVQLRVAEAPRPAGATARLRGPVVRDAAPARGRRRAAADREPGHQPAATPSTRS